MGLSTQGHVFGVACVLTHGGEGNRVHCPQQATGRPFVTKASPSPGRRPGSLLSLWCYEGNVLPVRNVNFEPLKVWAWGSERENFLRVWKSQLWFTRHELTDPCQTREATAALKATKPKSNRHHVHSPGTQGQHALGDLEPPKPANDWAESATTRGCRDGRRRSIGIAGNWDNRMLKKKLENEFYLNN